MSNLTELSEQEQRNLIVRKAAQEGLIEFSCTVDSRYDPQWFHTLIADKLEDVYKRVLAGESPRVMIFMPPRHGKSDEATQKLPAWILGKQPSWPIIVASYSQDLATNFGQGTRDLMESPNYRFIFDTRLRADTQAKANWMTEQKGGYLAVGVGGSITGKGFKIGIVDDPFKNREEADSPVVRESVWKWYGSTFETREEGASAIIVILTRWHDDDLAGRLLRRQEESEKNGEEFYDKWEVLEFKAIAEQDELPYRSKGDPLWPDKFSYEKLMKKKNSMGSYEWSALYQQNPIDSENQEFKKEWIQYRTQTEVDTMTVRKFATIDPAGSKKKTSDSTGVTRNYVNTLNEWNIKTKKYRINSKGIMNLIFELHEEGFETIGIEEGVYSEAIEPFFKDEKENRQVYPNVVPLKHGGTMKETRIRGLIPRYESRKIFHIENQCADLEEEYERFPKSAHDDCLDSLAYQNHIAMPPTLEIGDTIEEHDVTQNLTTLVNSQEGTIVIGLSNSFPYHYVMGNKEGLFYNAISDSTNPYSDIDRHLNVYTNSILLTDQVGDLIQIKKLQDKYPGKIFVADLKPEISSKDLANWGINNDYGTVTVGRNKLIQLISDEIKDRRLPIQGTPEDWKDFIHEWKYIFRIWEKDDLGGKKARWESNAPQHFIKATIFWRVGIDKYANSMASIVGSDPLAGLPVGRIFTE